MGNQVVIKKVFLGSPSDTSQERKCVDNVLQELNQALGDWLKIKFEAVKWETHTTPEMGRPQEVINNQLKIEKCDLFIGILWKRFGTPTGRIKQNGEPYDSGTEEEFDIAYSSWKGSKKPFMMIFRSAKPFSSDEVDAEELGKVNKFWNEFSYDKSHPGYYKKYHSIKEFEKVLRMSLVRYAVESEISVEQRDDTLPHHLRSNGIEKLFLPDLNSERNISKTVSLRNAKEIKLIAHSCYSYIAKYGHRFRDIIEEKLKEGCRFRAIASNAWSESSFFASYSEMIDKREQYTYIGTDGKRYVNCLKIIEESQCYKVKYNSSIDGYLALHETYGDLIQLKFTQYEMMSTILLTDKECYMEPYLPVNLEERYKNGMLTFEIKTSNTSYLYEHNRRYFDFLWGLSEDYEAYMRHIDAYKKRLKEKTQLEV